MRAKPPARQARDRFIQLRRCLPAIGLIPGARVARFSAGHAPHLETPDADTVFHVAHQERSAWTFEVDLRPFGGIW